MFDEEDFELLEDEEDEELGEDDTSSSFDNNQSGFKTKKEKENNKKDSDKVNAAKEKNNSAPGSNKKDSSSGGGFKPGGNNANKAMNGAKAAGGKMPSKPPTGGAPGGLNKAQIAKDAVNAITKDDPEAIKSLGREGLGEAAVIGAQAATSGAVGSDPITRTVIKEGVKKLAETPPMDKLLDQLVPVAKAAKKSVMIYLIGSVISFLIPAFLVLIAVAIPMVAVDDLISGFKDFFSSLGHWLTGDGWCATDAICNLDDAKDFTGIVGASEHVYSSYCGEYDFVLDTEMMTATIFYDEMVVGLGVNKQNLTPNEDADNYNYGDAAGLYGSQLKILYPNLFNFSDVIWLDSFEEEDLNQDYFIDYINDFKTKVDDRIYKIQGGDNKEEKEMTEEEAKKYVCTPDYDAYKEFLKDDFIPLTALYELRKDASNGYDEYTDSFIVNDILSFAKHYEEIGLDSNSSSGGTFVTGISGSIPIEILQNSINPLNESFTGVTGCFGKYGKNYCNSDHNGVDIGHDGGTPKIYSIADGVVETKKSGYGNCKAVKINDNISCPGCPQPAGNYIVIKHELEINGEKIIFYSKYLHLSSIVNDIRVGTIVKKGQQIGVMGNTGCSTATHLHFSMLDANKKTYNPEELLSYLNLIDARYCQDVRNYCGGL